MESQATSHKVSMIISIVSLFIVVGLMLVYIFYTQKPMIGPLPTNVSKPLGGSSSGAPIIGSDLGSQVYEKSTNPLSDKLPETIAPVPNPLENAYKNPFE
ncbi:hypothetical protein HY967_03880 [Candidatus Jorgensenbacteria bacterium]|nr:hypothetical protein [Candidatus Jorgensenbacteria bacterium]